MSEKKPYEITSYGIKRKLTDDQRLKLLRKAINRLRKAINGNDSK